MFKPDKKLQKLIAKLSDGCGGICGYVYRDGVVLVYKKTKVVDGVQWEKEYIDVFPCEINIRYSHRRNANADSLFRGRLVYHNASLLINGISSVDIYEDNSSTSSKRIGLEVDTLVILTMDCMRLRLHLNACLSSDVIYQDETEGFEKSINDWKVSDNYSSCFTIHKAS